MEPWAVVVAAVAVGLVSGLLVLSVGIIGRSLRRVFPPPPKASQLTVSHTGEEQLQLLPERLAAGGSGGAPGNFARMARNTLIRGDSG